ncbi:MAG TPA: hypothetical protein VN408_43655 [Actinoplanes sp.]|nr:hypothetical protein [Actinoplanes sp.]
MVADEPTFRLLSETYVSFEWPPDEYDAYLDAHDDAVRRSRRDDTMIHVGRFDHDDYLEFCADDDLPPDGAGTRAAYAVWATDAGEAGEWPGSVREFLLNMSLLDAVESDPDARFDEAMEVAEELLDELTGLMATAPPGPGSFTVTVSADGDSLVFPWTASRTRLQLHRPLDVLLTAVIAGTVQGGALIARFPTRVMLPDRVKQSRVLGWRLGGHEAAELSESELFSAFCTDAVTGEPLPPEYGTVYGRD